MLLNQVARMLQDQGKLAEAKPLMEECMQACRATLGNDHPHTLISINSLASLLQDMGELAEAKPLMEEALQAEKETLAQFFIQLEITVYLLLDHK